MGDFIIFLEQHYSGILILLLLCFAMSLLWIIRYTPISHIPGYAKIRAALACWSDLPTAKKFWEHKINC